MKRLLTLLLTVLLLCTSTLTTRVAFAEDEASETEETAEVLETQEEDAPVENVEEDFQDQEVQAAMEIDEEGQHEKTEEEIEGLSEHELLPGLMEDPPIEKQSSGSTIGEAYAILTDEGELIFFRSNETYQSFKYARVTDIKNNQYYGKVYASIETMTIGDVEFIPWYPEHYEIRSVRVASGQSIRPYWTAHWFEGCENIETMDLSGFDTYRTGLMTSMFDGCDSLKSVTLGVDWINWKDDAYLPFGFWQNGSYLKSEAELYEAYNQYPSQSAEYMGTWTRSYADAIITENGDLIYFRTSNEYSFKEVITIADCEGTEYTGTVCRTDIEKEDTSNEREDTDWFTDQIGITPKTVSVLKGDVIRPKAIRFSYNTLESFNADGIDTSGMTDMSYLFYDCGSLKALDLSGFNTGNVTDMSGMFDGCSSLTSLVINNFDTSSVTEMISMFAYCRSLTSLDISNFVTTNVTTMSNMFSYCDSLTDLDLSGFDTTNVADMNYMFSNCKSIKSIDIEGFVTTNVTDMSGMFTFCTSLLSLDLGGWNVSKVISMADMFNCCSSMTTLNLTGWYAPEVVNMNNMFFNCTDLLSLDLSSFRNHRVENEYRIFTMCKSLKSLDLSNFKLINYGTSAGYTYVDGPFEDCKALESLNIKNIDLSANTDFSNLFRGCSSLRSLDVSGIDTSKVTNMHGMFDSCGSLRSLDVTGFDTSNVTDMTQMFSGCSSLTSIDVMGFDTSKVTSMSSMFSYCSSLTDIDVSGFDTSNVESIGYMFQFCENLRSLDLSGFDTRNVKNMNYLVLQCNRLKTLDLSSFDTSRVEQMEDSFFGCDKLVRIALGPKFTVWPRAQDSWDDPYLPKGTWTNATLGISKTEEELLNEYPSHAAQWAGWWTRKIDNEDIAYAVLQENGELVFFRSEGLFSDNTFVKQEAEDIEGNTYYGYIFKGIESEKLVTAPWYIYKEDITSVKVADQQIVDPLSMARWFRGCVNLRSFYSTGFYTRKVEDMSELFSGCINLNYIDLSAFDTYNAMHMDGMFLNCDALEMVVLGKNFTNWLGYSYLRRGTWKSSSTGEIHNEVDLHDNYPKKASEWAGTWSIVSISDGRAEQISDEFHFVSELSNQNLKYSFDYDENWFLKDAREYDQNIALMSIKMAMASMSDGTYTYSDNISELYSSLQYRCVMVDYPVPSDNSIGYVMGFKNFTDNNGNKKTIIAITVRSGGYGDEWAGNFEIGYESDHSGFNKGAETIESKLVSYMNRYKPYFGDEVKIWISGYSRGAAVANLLAAKLDRMKYNGTSNKNIFAYCFECPQNTSDLLYFSTLYNNIFSIVNPIDLVTKVAPNEGRKGDFTGWRYKRYGQVLTIYNQLNLNYQTRYKEYMMAKYKDILKYNDLYFFEWAGGLDKAVSELTYEKIGQGVALDHLISEIAGMAFTAENYVSVNEKAMMGIIRKTLGKGQDPNFTEDIIVQVITLLMPQLIMAVYDPIDLLYLLSDGAILLELFATDNTDIKYKYEQKSFAFRAHYPELCLSWMEAFKENPDWIRQKVSTFDSSQEIEPDAQIMTEDDVSDEEETYTVYSFASTTYRLISVDPTVDISIYDNNNDSILEVVAGEVQGESSLYTYLDNNGQRMIALPDDLECNINMRATEDNPMAYSCIEIDSADNAVSKVVTYTNIPVETGDELMGVVDDISNGTECSYNLYKEDESVDPTYEQKGEEVNYHNITVNVRGDGAVLGNGYYTSGEYVQLRVVDGESNFLGWYENDELIGEELNYRFLAEQDRTITARFSNNIYVESLSFDMMDEVLVKGMTKTFALDVYPENATHKEVEWYVYDESIATVDQQGTVTALSPGETKVAVYSIDGSGTMASCNVKVISADEERYGTIRIEDRSTFDELGCPEGLWTTALSDLVYTPGIKSYTQSFTVYDGKTLLHEGTDYTLKYASNSKAGTATVTINGRGNYVGTLIKKFDILPLELTKEDVVVILNKNCFVYNGKTQKAAVKSLEYNGVKLKNKTDYTVSYETPSSSGNASDISEYAITITLKGNYHGVINDVYTIIPKDQEVLSLSNVSVSGVKDLVYTGLELEQEPIVKDGKTTLTNNSDYAVSYRNNVDAGTAYLIIEGIGSYKGTIIKPFKIKSQPLSNAVIAEPEDKKYIGTSVIQEGITVTYAGKDLIENSDYTISYKNNTKAGKATMTIKGIGNYSGTVNKSFMITKGEIVDYLDENNCVEVSYYNTYQKGGTKPEPKVLVDGVLLKNGTDYAVTYKNNKALGEALLIISGKGNYTGKVERSFGIFQRYISSVNFQVSDRVYSTKANGWKSVPVLTDTDGKKLKAGTDYDKTIIYTYRFNTKVLDGSSKEKVKPEIERSSGEEIAASDILPAGTAVNVTITTNEIKTKNYKGTATSFYRIKYSDISKAKVTIPNQYYTGKPVTLSKADITVKLGKDMLMTTDYDIVSYENNVLKGTAKLTIKGKGNYGGTKTVTFKIVQKSLGMTIKFNPNGATSGSMKDQMIYKDTKLPKNTFKRTEILSDGSKKTYEFLGFNTKYDGSGDWYRPGDLFPYDQEKAGTFVMLWAVWQ